MSHKLTNSLLEDQKSNRQVVYQRGSQRENSPHYVFLYSDDENSADEENISLRIVSHSTSVPQKVKVINVEVKPEDSLQALALRYRCTISEMKRINKIDKENEIYAKPYIKVPVKPFSILTETLNEDQEDDSIAVLSHHKEEIDALETEQLTDLNTTVITTEPRKAEINTIILNSVCEPLICDNVSVDNDTEYEQLLSNSESTEMDDSCDITDMFKCSGDDWGLSWMQLLGCSLLLGFIGPIIYILYITEHPYKTNTTVSD